MQIKDSVVIVTGGASGLGQGTVRYLVEREARAVIIDLNQDMGQALVQELGASARFVKGDVSSDADGRAAVACALDSFGSLNGLVNCAGIGTPEKVLGKDGPQSLAPFTKIIQVNLIGSFNMIRLAADAMSRAQPNAAGERGVIVNTASVAAYEGQIGQAAYAASKGGVVGMTLPIAREFSRVGIRVCTIAPGLFLTPLMAVLPEPARKSLAESVPFPARLGRPDEYASLVAHIFENEMMNGETIRIDGALRMAPR
ncbi:MAG: putative oxidoreductase [Rhodocyclaceae bacterium]|jgi:NAD(P)-dependent dehydrogenase (short-subunit alcohol dehydrogenase family)|nr:putative oxidoreductase [Rhodocyclaceae bacterium]